jgi:hypothetical protein
LNVSFISGLHRAALLTLATHSGALALRTTLEP